MRDEYSKTLWGVPYMPPTVLRVPWNSNDGDSQYLDVSRWIPGGDIFEERETGVPGVPAPLQPSFGLYGDIYNVAVARTDPFTGQEIEGLGLDEDGKAIAKALFKRLTPNLPIIPGSYSYEKIARSLRTDKGVEKGELVPGSEYAVPYSFGESIAYSLGIKLRPQDPDVNQKSKEFQLNKDLKAADRIAYNAKKDFEKANITYKEREELIKKAELRRIQILAEWEVYTQAYNEARAKRIKRIQREKQAKGGIVEGEDNVPFTKEDPADRINPYTGEPYQEQMNRLGFSSGGDESQARMQEINTYLKGKGYSKEARAGIIANIGVETGYTYDPKQKQINGKGYGLFQLDDKRDDYNAWLSERGFEEDKINNMAAQLEYMHDTIQTGREIGGGNANTLQKSFNEKSAEDIAVDFSNIWEKPGVPHLDRRINMANKLLNVID
jgi:hypothetical protein